MSHESLHICSNKRISDFCGLSSFETVTPAEHLRAWFHADPRRLRLISARAVDLLAGRPVGTFSRFLSGEKYMTFERTGVAHYYAVLAAVGYVPPIDVTNGLKTPPEV
jgi:hypothetical protein